MNNKCQNCKQDFIIEPDSAAFYEKMQTPHPTWCDQCRLIRRMIFSNEVVLYKRTCDLTKKDIVSIYDKDAVFPVYHTEEWYSDAWNPNDYGKDVDFNRPFLEQLIELQTKVPRMSLIKQGTPVRSEYTNRVKGPKDSYMVFRSMEPEECMYSYWANNSLQCVDSIAVVKCELCYECIECENCYHTHFSQESKECRDSYFLYNCTGCTDCVGSVNLRKKQYYIFNQPYSKEDYFKKLESMQLHTRPGLEKTSQKFEEHKLRFPRKYMSSLQSQNVSGNWVYNCENAHNSYMCYESKDIKNCYQVFRGQDCQDYLSWGDSSELMYEVSNSGINCSRMKFSNESWNGGTDLEYCDASPSAKNCFGCVGMKNGEYCILNKKYSKQEYGEMVEKIKQHMNDMPHVDNLGREYKYGEFLPLEMSSFAYNETVAQMYFPLTKQEVEKWGYTWKDKKRVEYKATKDWSALPDNIEEVDDSIMQEIISCKGKDQEESPGVFRITAQELDLYRKMNIPLPQYSFLVRQLMRMLKRTPMKLYKRVTEDGVEVMTPYAPDRPERILSEEGYQDEVM